MNLTYEDCQTAHYLLWDWLVNNPGKSKADWPGWDNGEYKKFEGHFIPDGSFACYATRKRCYKCPVNALTEQYKDTCLAPYSNCAAGITWWAARVINKDVACATLWAARIRDSWRQHETH